MSKSTTTPSFAKVFFRTFGYAMLLLSAYPGIAASPGARRAMSWNRLDTAALLVDLVAIPLVLALVLWGLDKLFRGRLFRLGKPLLPFLCAIALMQLVPQHLLHVLHLDKFGVFFPYLCMASVGGLLSALAWRKHWNGLLDGLAAFLPVLSVLFPVYAVQFFSFPPYTASRTFNAVSLRPPDSPNPNVLVFSFDSIGQDDCVTPDGTWRSDLPATRAFQEEAVRFDAAASGGTHTMGSVPKFLFQTSSGAEIPGDPAPAADGEDIAAPGTDSLASAGGLLHLAQSSGYRTAAVTSYVPLGQMAGPLLDEALDLPFSRYLPPSSFAMRCLDHLAAFADFFRPRIDAFARQTRGRFPWPPHRLANRYFIGLVQTQLDAIHAHAGRLPPSGEFFYAHLVGVHRPRLFLEDGTVDEARATADTQLRFTDSVFGTLMDDLRARDRFDSAWIIFTADHGVQSAGASEEELCHVPFVVKPPHGTRPVVCGAPVRQWDMAPFFRAVFEGLPPDRCLELLAPGQFGR